MKRRSGFISGLELGPSSVLNIAQKSGLARPTTYEIIKSLENKGLFAETKQKKKRYFAAQSPEKILGLLRIQKREIEEKEREFIRIISALESKYSKEKEEIKVYKGKEGLRALEETLSFSSTPEILVINPKDNPIGEQKRKNIYQAIRKRLGRVNVQETEAEFKGSLIIFDKVIFFPPGKQKAFLFV